MKIGVVYQSIYPRKIGGNGGDRRVRDIVRGLISAGNDVILLVPVWQNKGVKNVDDFEINYLGSLNLSNIPILNRISFWKAVLKFNMEALLFYNTTFESALVAKFINKKILTVAEFCDLPSANKNVSIMRWVKGLFQFYGSKFLAQNTRKNVVISDYLKNKISSYSPNKPILQLPILVDSGIFHFDAQLADKFRYANNISEDEVLITYVGGIWYNEGVDYLLRSFAELVKSCDNIKLIIAGNLGSTVEHVPVTDLVHELRIEKSVICTGWIDTKEIIGLLSASNILTVPQINHEFCIAGLPTKLAEYASMGKAIVATDVGDVSKYFENHKEIMLCEPSDINDLYTKLKLLVESSHLRGAIGNSAFNVARASFDYKVSGKLLSDFMAKDD